MKKPPPRALRRLPIRPSRSARVRREPEPVSETLLPWEDPASAVPRSSPAAAKEEALPASTGEITPSASWPKRPFTAAENLGGVPFQYTGQTERRAAETAHDLPPAFNRSAQRDPECAPPSTSRELEDKHVAAAIKAKFEEFNVFGSVVQINPGPVVTTFEFKPEAGIKYSRITNTSWKTLCLGLAGRIDSDRAHPGQADHRHRSSPNTKREVISLRVR